MGRQMLDLVMSQLPFKNKIVVITMNKFYAKRLQNFQRRQSHKCCIVDKLDIVVIHHSIGK